MFSSKFFPIAVIVAVAHANTASNSQVLRRHPPTPSTYPLGNACGNEWRYLNFNPSDKTDRKRLRKLHEVICDGELHKIASYGRKSAKGTLAPYKRYFPQSDDKNDFQAQVIEVLDLIAGSDSSHEMAGDIVRTFVVDNVDFDKDENGASCDDEAVQAYTEIDNLDHREKIHFCNNSWKKLKAADVKCSSLKHYPSRRMETFSLIVLHEMTHYSSVGPKTSLGREIVDEENKDGKDAYYPRRVHGLLAKDQDDRPEKTVTNADSYAWMSLDAWISHLCSGSWIDNQWASYFTQNPPAYERGSSETSDLDSDLDLDLSSDSDSNSDSGL
ncbi:MAG: hypothetical protein M1820_001928 [Bogoriella megaspora]|nr:MAG: hypothetical protein M1820_001928 [Bogoriella megaspora]